MGHTIGHTTNGSRQIDVPFKCYYTGYAAHNNSVLKILRDNLLVEVQILLSNKIRVKPFDILKTAVN
jgi:hypothetical protein